MNYYLTNFTCRNYYLTECQNDEKPAPTVAQIIQQAGRADVEPAAIQLGWIIDSACTQHSLPPHASQVASQKDCFDYLVILYVLDKQIQC